MATKATKNTPNKELVNDILDDQISMAITHLSHGPPRRNRLYHNVKELYRRLGETIDNEDLIYYG